MLRRSQTSLDSQTPLLVYSRYYRRFRSHPGTLNNTAAPCPALNTELSFISYKSVIA